MNLQLVTLDGIKYSKEAYAITLPTAAGEITVFPDHEPLMSVLVPGVVSVRAGKNDPDQLVEHFATFGGVLEITKDSVKVLVDEADSGEEISEQEAENARKAAEKLKSEAKNQVELDKAQALVDRQAVRLQVAQLRRRHNRRG
jgi:F-type H+-transporting ATPase subunit epsilon